MSSFSPDVYGPRLAAALEAHAYRLELRYELGAMGYPPYHQSFRTITQPEGTFAEADYLLSCSDVKYSPVYRLLGSFNLDDDESSIDPDELKKALPFAPDLITQVNRLYTRGNSRAEHIKRHQELESTFIHSVLEFRQTLRHTIIAPPAVVDDPPPSPFFSDTLFGPHVAKVINALLSLEIRLVDNDARPPNFPQYHRSKIIAYDQSEQRRTTIALRSGRGTAFLGDALVLQYSVSDTGYMIRALRTEEGDFGLMEALFPEFGTIIEANLPDYKFNYQIYQALQNVRNEMCYIITIVDGKVVPTLMAGNRRLGQASLLLGKLDNEILCMIARMVLLAEKY